MAMPLPMIELLNVLKPQVTSLVDTLTVNFKSDPLLVKGRYVKLARDVS